MNDTFVTASPSARYLDPVAPAAELGLPDVLGRIDGALGRLDNQIAITIERLEPVLRPIPPQAQDAAMVTSGMPPSAITEKLFEFLRQIDSLTEAVERTKNRLDF